MPQQSFRNLFRRGRREKAADASKGNPGSEASPETSSTSTSIQMALCLNPKDLVSNELQRPDEPSSTAPCSAVEATAPEVSELAPPSQREPGAGRKSQAPSELGNGQTYNGSKPYATTFDLWQKALKHLDDSETRDIKNLIGEVTRDPENEANVKSLAAAIQDKIQAAFREQKYDSRTDHIIENSVSMLNKFSSAVDVAVSFDPAHAALPWALVRFVLVVSSPVIP